MVRHLVPVMSVPAIQNTPCCRAIDPVHHCGDRGFESPNDDRSPVTPVRFSKYLERINIEDRIELRTSRQSQADLKDRNPSAKAQPIAISTVHESPTTVAIEKAYGSKVTTVRGRFIDTLG